MSAATGVDAGAPNLNLTPEEKRVYGQLFRLADEEGVGVVTGEVAVKFFEKTRLDSRILGEIWQIADKENRGFLTPAGFSVVLRLIGHAQAGREPTPDLALQQGPIPRFEGLWPPQPPSQPPLQPQSSGGAIRIPPLTLDKCAQYKSLFERQNLQGGLLPGEQARSIFDKSGLSNETLGKIWALSDTDQKGALALAQFIIAMHLLTSTKTGALRAIPNALPPGLYEAASRTPTTAAPRQSPSSTGIPAAIPRQLSGSAQQQRNGSPLGRPPLVAQAPSPSAAAPNNDWVITPTEKAKFDQIFEGFDKSGRGFITGEEAVPFLSQSNLSEESLAQIWDLADFDSQGHLSKDGFAVAMYLIRQQRSSRATPLPSTLPLALIPPYRRTQVAPQAQAQAVARPVTAVSAASAFDPSPITASAAPAPKSALDDLFGLDSSSPSSAMAPTQTSMSTGGSNVNVNDPFSGGSSALRPSSPLSKSTTPGVATFKPFVPASSFGRGLAGQPLGDPTSHRAISEDLLSDNDHEASKKISEDATELANLSNQISSLAKQTQEVQSKRALTQNELNQTNSSKQNFESRLSQLRQLYEKEAQDTQSLEEQLRISRTDTQKLRGECMTLEGQLRDVQTQHQQVSSALQVDQQENTSLRERIRAVNGEIARLKPLIEKLKLEARQQKGLVAINKKQLSTTEGERDKMKSEADSLSRSMDDMSRQVETGSPASAPAQVASPAPSTSSGNNPFFKRSTSTDILGVFGSQPSRSFDKSPFEDLFGPAAGPSSTSHGTTPPPMTAFGSQHTGQSSASVGSYSNISAPSPSVSRHATQSAVEPPASSELRQLSSANLPFPEHDESLSSSRHVSPPTSRAEGSGSGSFSFPGMGTTAAEAGKAQATAKSSEDVERNDSVSATPVQATQGRGLGPLDSTDSAKAKEDFDNAFAAFESSKSPVLAPADASKSLATTFDAEFPPITEPDREDSDSASEGGGFDDDFAPASPEASSKEAKLAAATSEPHHASAELGEMTAVSMPHKESALEGKGVDLPSSPTTITHNNGPTSQTSTVDEIFGSGTLTASSFHVAPTQTKGAFDDPDDDFEGLEDAKEGSADDDFANISRSGLDDYNPMFDSSPPASQAKSESTTFGNESAFDFISSNSVASGTAGPNNQQKGSESQDWDAIFANLDSTGAAAQPAANNLVGVANDDDSDPRPAALGRALTETGEHDDPMLKRLTGMGYARHDALNALEKYDYNLDQAADHLASQS